MKILAVGNRISHLGSVIEKDIKNNPEDSQIKSNKFVQFATAGAGVAAIVGGILIHKNIKINKAEKFLENALAKKYPKDVEYRKSLLKAIGLSEDKWFSIRSIVGGQEYKSIVGEYSNNPKAYTSGVSLITEAQDDYSLIGVRNKTFRISLHNHTDKSDGKMSVQQLLNQAAKYADEVAQVNERSSHVIASDAPFTIAITDHDTVEGCKEAVKIISENPDKFKNLRVVFGTELSVENKMLGDNLTKPVPLHLVVNCIDPFDKNLNEFLDGIKAARKTVAKDFLENFKSHIAENNAEIFSRFDYEDAKDSSTVIREGLNYPWYYLKSYAKNKLNSSEQDSILKIFDDVQRQYEPKLEMQDYCMDMDKVIELVKKQDYGYMTIAHPALTSIGKSLKDSSKSSEMLSELISLFKKKGEDRALAVEIHYPYFGEVGKSSDWLNMISKSVSENKLLAAGGLDSHGKSIFYSEK